MYVITGASGHTGKALSEILLKAGKPVRVIGRSAENLAGLAAQGADVAIGSLEDAAFLTQAFAGATAVYAMIPPNFATNDFRGYQNTVGKAITQALKANQVSRVVTLSSVGANLSEGSGVLLGLYDFENLLAAELPQAHVLHLRAGFFMENFFGMSWSIAAMGALAGFPMRADIPMVMVHTRDIAAKAAQHLLAADFSGHGVEYVAGPREYTFQESAAILGAAIGKPELGFVQLPYEQAAQGMAGMGMTPSLVNAYIDFSRTFNERNVEFLGSYVRNASNTTPTTLEEFAANEFAPALAAQGQPA